MNKLLQRIEALEGRMKPQPSAFLQKLAEEAAELMTYEELSAVKECSELLLAGRWEEVKPAQLAAYLRIERLQWELKAAQGVITIEPDTDSLTIGTPQYIVKLSVDRQDAGRVIVQKTERRTAASTFCSEPA